MLFTLLMALYPMLCRVAETNRDLLFSRVEMLISVLLILGLLSASIFSLFSRELVTLLYGKEFLGSALVIELQVWYLIFFIIFSVFGTVLSAFNQQKNLSKLSLAYALVSLPIFYFASAHGSQGLSAGYILSAIINFSYHVYFFWKWTGKSISLSFLNQVMLLLSITSILVPLIMRFVVIAFSVKILISILLVFVASLYLLKQYRAFNNGST